MRQIKVIKLKIHNKVILEINESIIDNIVGIYPDEHLAERHTFTNAKLTGELSFSELKKECATLLIPWQLFLLKPEKLITELEKITAKRSSKFDTKLIASRDNEGHGISLRIADRIILLQEFANKNIDSNNDFCGSLKPLHRDKWPKAIIDFFNIDTAFLASGKKQKTLDYIIKCLETKNIRVAQGVLNTNKLLPIENNIRATYRKSSGFTVKDSKVPYIFLPSEVNDSETPGRQIFTLLALVVLIGLDAYNIYINSDFEARTQGQNLLQHTYGTVSEILLPYEESKKFTNIRITEEIRDELASRFMLTPSAVIVTLNQRGLIQEDGLYEQLLNTSSPKPVASAFFNRPKLDTSVKKLCGPTTMTDIVKGLRIGSLASIDAQYLMFGRVDKLKFEKFKAGVGL